MTQIGKPKTGWSDQTFAKARALYKLGKTDAEIALGVCKSLASVKHLRASLGLPENREPAKC